MRWNIVKVDADSDRCAEYLTEGWEPFAVTRERRETWDNDRCALVDAGYYTDVVWLRRQEGE